MGGIFACGRKIAKKIFLGSFCDTLVIQTISNPQYQYLAENKHNRKNLQHISTKNQLFCLNSLILVEIEVGIVTSFCKFV